MHSDEIASFKFGPGFFYLGIVSIAAGVFILSMPAPGYAGSTLIGFGFLYLFLGTRTYIRMYPDMMAVGIGGANVVRYADIKRVEKKGKSVHLHPRDGGKPRRFGINQLRKEDAASFLALLNAKVAEAAGAKSDAATPEPQAVGDTAHAPQKADRPADSTTESVPDPVPVFNGLVVTSLFINTLVSVLAGLDPAGPGMVLAIVMGSFVALSLVGLLLLQSGNLKAGNILAFIGFALFVPIGIIGVMGVARHVGYVRRLEATA